ncbi:MAG TPA: hypothetical protein VNM36_06860 [Gemmatimonadaceae bacterium]|nr:hypothetical protein [Gemmatimonadaceae bacterium]
MNLAELKLKPYARIAAMGALGVCAGTLGLFVFLAFYTRSIPLGGIDQTQALLSWISLAIPFSLIIGAHLVYARVLMKYAKE